MLGRMTFVFLLLLSCLIASLIAAPLAATAGTNQKGNEIGEFLLVHERPSPLRAVTPEAAEGKDAKAENVFLQSIFGTLLAFPNYVAASLEGLLNGVVSRLLGSGLKTSDSEDFR
ncbi:hypothetical protein J437_LFUL008087 [Ladona fulva]|uniref:Uncharacterized protein n=1 Tax=Ladona fulva TaxID=123851 RepID=A0A8K0P0U2_LADFU|nr:hypothetical protein J437_LFUL008087 [Ladona fulva]